MKEFISYSELSEWLKGPETYFNKYVLGVRDPETPAMIYGTIIHEAIANQTPFPEVEKQLIARFFTGDYIRVAKSLITLPRPKSCEFKAFLAGNEQNGLKTDVLAYLDGYDVDTHTVYEHKTTANGWANQQLVDESLQLTFYAMIMWFITGTIPKLILNRLDTKNGRIKTYETARTEEQCLMLVEQINTMYEDLVEKGWWSIRKASKPQSV